MPILLGKLVLQVCFLSRDNENSDQGCGWDETEHYPPAIENQADANSRPAKSEINWIARDTEYTTGDNCRGRPPGLYAGISAPKSEYRKNNDNQRYQHHHQSSDHYDDRITNFKRQEVIHRIAKQNGAYKYEWRWKFNISAFLVLVEISIHEG